MPRIRRSYRAKGETPGPPKVYRVIRCGVEIHICKFYTDAWTFLRGMVDRQQAPFPTVQAALASGDFEIIPKDPISPLPLRAR